MKTFNKKYIYIGTLFFVLSKAESQTPYSADLGWIQSPTAKGISSVLFAASLVGWLGILMYKSSIVSPRRPKLEDLLSRNEYDRALQLYKSKITSNKTLLHQIATYYASSGKVSTLAEEIYLKVYRDNTQDKNIIIQLGRCLAKHEKTDKDALLIYHKILEWGIRETAILRVAALFYFKNKDIPEALLFLVPLCMQLDSKTEYKQLLTKIVRSHAITDPQLLSLAIGFLQEIPPDQNIVKYLADNYTEPDYLSGSTINLFEKALGYEPENKVYRIRLSQALLRQKKIGPCIEQCRYFIEKGDLDQDVMELLGEMYICTGQYVESLELFTKLYQDYPDERKYLYGVARAKAGLNLIDPESITIYKEQLLIHPKDDLINYCLFKKALRENNLSDIINHGLILLDMSDHWPQNLVNDLSPILKKYPDHEGLLDIYIQSLILLKQYSLAIESIEHIKQTAYDPGVSKNLIKYYTNILKVDPKYFEARVKRAEMAEQDSEIDLAIEDYEWIRSQKESNTQFNDRLVDLYRHKIRHTDNPPPESFYHLGILYEEKQQWQEAIIQFQHSAKFAEFEASSKVHIASCFLAMGKPDIAERQFSDLDLNETQKDMLYSMAKQYIDEGMPDKAVVILDKIHQVDSKFKDIDIIRHQTAIKGHQDFTSKKVDNKTTSPRFQIIDEIARGGMGIVFCALDTILNEMVALKSLPQGLDDDPQARERFLREVKATRKLIHKNIVRIFDVVEDQGHLFISMEFIKGKTLRQILKERDKLSEKEAAIITIQICQALSTAHEQGIIHRDIKPANIMIDINQIIKVMDFGIAKNINSDQMTSTTDMLGTPLYMSPEQCQGNTIDTRSDIYSLGVLLFELVTGETPFKTGNIAYHHIHTQPVIPDFLSETMRHILTRCLAKKPDERYSYVMELASDLNKI